MTIVLILILRSKIGSKRRIRWLFGWDNEDNQQQHEISLTHSMVSGKKEIFEDGILVFYSSAFSISEFETKISISPTIRILFTS